MAWGADVVESQKTPKVSGVSNWEGSGDSCCRLGGGVGGAVRGCQYETCQSLLGVRLTCWIPLLLSSSLGSRLLEFFLNRLYLLEHLRPVDKLNSQYRKFPCAPAPCPLQFPAVYSWDRCDTANTAAAWAPEVHSGHWVHSWCCTFCGFRQMHSSL